jgi:hypothetical protein
MTSNHFLASLGEPTAMEAAIGVVYEREGTGGGLYAYRDHTTPSLQEAPSPQQKARELSRQALKRSQPAMPVDTKFRKVCLARACAGCSQTP